MPKLARYLLPLLLPLLLAACSGTRGPQLTPVGVAIPEGVTFEGRWQLRDTAGESGAHSDTVPLVGGRKSRREKDSPSVQVFLETGSNLKVSQTSHGLFISFDRSVVEEYRFREHRGVNVGPIAAERVSGWEDGRYVIQTVDAVGALLTETYSLRDNGQQLVRTATIVYKEQETLSLRQVFDRLE